MAFLFPAMLRWICGWTAAGAKPPPSFATRFLNRNSRILLRDFGEENARETDCACNCGRTADRDRTRQLAEVIERVAPRRGQKIHPATRSFQALRIAVNDELGELERGLDCRRTRAEARWPACGRFVSLARRPHRETVSRTTLRPCAAASAAYAGRAAEPALFRAIGKSPVVPTAEEIRRNPRARSAKLRAAERTNVQAPGPAQTGEGQ